MLLYDWNSVQVRLSRELSALSIYVCTDVNSLANVYYLYER